MYPVLLAAMHPWLLPAVALLLLGFAACGGGVLATLHFKKIPIPRGIPIAHGVLAGCGIFSLYMGIFDGWINGIGAIALYGFLATALVGAYMFGVQAKGRPIPTKAIILHATLALASYVTLIVAIFGSGGPPRVAI